MDLDDYIPPVIFPSAHDKPSYHGDWADNYDDIMGTISGYNECTHTLTTAFASLRPELVVDLGAGTGRFTSTMADVGGSECHVVGVDCSEPLLLRLKEANFNANIELHWADIAGFRLPDWVKKPADLSLCLHGTINYLTELGELRRLVSTVESCTRVNGIAVFDLLGRRAIESGLDLQSPKFELRVTTEQLDDSDSYLVTERFSRTDTDPSSGESQWRCRYWPSDVISDLMEQSGFLRVDGGERFAQAIAKAYERSGSRPFVFRKRGH